MIFKTTTSSFFLFFLILSCSAQKINSEKVFGGYKFTQNGETLNFNQLLEQVSSNEQSKKLVRSAKSKSGFSVALASVGGALIGFPIGASIGGGDPVWALAGVGAALWGISFPIASSAGKQAKEAVR